MSHSDRYDHVLGEEFDDYEDRRRCSSCRTTPRRGSRTRCPPAEPEDCIRVPLSNADVYLIVLMVGLAAGIVWLIYDPVYGYNVDGGAKHNIIMKKMQKPPLLKRLWHMVRPSNSKRIRRCHQNQPDRSDGCVRDVI